jgi:hypothetical protein
VSRRIENFFCAKNGATAAFIQGPVRHLNCKYGWGRHPHHVIPNAACPPKAGDPAFSCARPFVLRIQKYFRGRAPACPTQEGFAKRGPPPHPAVSAGRISLRSWWKPPTSSRGSGAIRVAHQIGGRTFRSDIKPPHPTGHSERSDPAFSCAHFLCAGSRREESLLGFEIASPAFHRLEGLLLFQLSGCVSAADGGRAGALRGFGFGAGQLKQTRCPINAFLGRVE